MSSATAELVVKQIQQKPDSVLCFPSGDTPTGLLKLLVEYSRQGKVDFSKCEFVGLDEWVGMDKSDKGSCQHYMYEQFFIPSKISPSKITFFNAKAKDLKTECKQVDQFIFDHGGLDLVIVGVGLNGHIGLNEPGASFDSYCHFINLEDTTKNVAQKYFTGSTVLSQGITLGIKHMLEAKTAVVIASAEKKSAIIQKIVECPITEQVPGSILQRHSNCFFMLDKGAASKLKSI